MYTETEVFELKKSLSQLKEGIISMSSMLNKHGKGEVIFGINDEGKVVGLTVGKKTIADITHEIQNCLKPLPNDVQIHELKKDKKSIIQVKVSGEDTPYCAYGRYYIRINDADILMDAGQLQKYFEEKKDTYSNWEQSETIYGIEDIDEDCLIDCIRTANENGRLNYVYRNAKEALHKLGLLTENEKLNQAGYYLFGSHKPLTIKFANYPTDTRTEFGQIREFNGNIFECIQEAISYIQNHISFKSEIVGYQREEKPEIPLRALREIVINSFAHCSYARKGDFNQYIIYKSSIRIYNPGSIIKGTDPIQFASGKVGSKLRNPLIASTLFKYGYIDAFGTGFDRTFTLCAKDNIKYSYYADDFGFTFIFDRKQDFLEESISYKVQEKVNLLDYEIVALIQNNKYITIPEIAKETNKSQPTIARHLNAMVKKHIIERIGSRKSGYWQTIKRP